MFLLILKRDRLVVGLLSRDIRLFHTFGAANINESAIPKGL